MSNIIDFENFKLKNLKKVIRLYQDQNDIKVLYSFKSNDSIIFPQHLLFWALLSDQTTVGLLTMNKHLVIAENLSLININFHGYTNKDNDYITEEAPHYIKSFLINDYELYHRFLKYKMFSHTVIQELLDKSGTYLFYVERKKAFLYPIHSWKLLDNGSIIPFIAYQKELANCPLIENDKIYFPYEKNYFFIDYDTAQQVKQKKVSLSDIYNRLNI